MNLYAVQRLVGKIDDVSEFREEFVSIFDTKTKSEMAKFGLLLGKHIINFTGFEAVDEITAAFAAVQEWIDGKGKVNYHKARTLAGTINDLARIETDPIKKKFYRAMAQISAIPHVKFHALWATDFAVALINMMYPGDLDTVRKERQTQIELLKKEL